MIFYNDIYEEILFLESQIKVYKERIEYLNRKLNQSSERENNDSNWYDFDSDNLNWIKEALIIVKNENIQCDSLEDDFAKYLKEVKGLKDSSIESYIDSLQKLKKLLEARFPFYLPCEIYETANLKLLSLIQQTVKSNGCLYDVNTKWNHYLSAAINNYIEFIEFNKFPTGLVFDEE